MKLQRAVVLSTWLYSLLFWLYVVARITLNNIDPNERFLSRVPYITFFTVGVLSFALSFICLVAYLTMWGFRSEGEPEGTVAVKVAGVQSLHYCS
jgi:hypothetical protein